MWLNLRYSMPWSPGVRSLLYPRRVLFHSPPHRPLCLTAQLLCLFLSQEDLPDPQRLSSRPNILIAPRTRHAKRVLEKDTPRLIPLASFLSRPQTAILSRPLPSLVQVLPRKNIILLFHRSACLHSAPSKTEQCIPSPSSMANHYMPMIFLLPPSTSPQRPRMHNR